MKRPEMLDGKDGRRWMIDANNRAHEIKPGGREGFDVHLVGAKPAPPKLKANTPHAALKAPPKRQKLVAPAKTGDLFE